MDGSLSRRHCCGPGGGAGDGGAACLRNLPTRLTSLRGFGIFLWMRNVWTFGILAIRGWKSSRAASRSSSRTAAPPAHSNPLHSYTPFQRAPKAPYTQASHNSPLTRHPQLSAQSQNRTGTNILHSNRSTTLVQE